MSNQILEGFKKGIGFMLVVVIFLTAVYAAGFHDPSEVREGTFEGDYSILGNLGVSTSQEPEVSLEVGSGEDDSTIRIHHQEGNYYDIESRGDSLVIKDSENNYLEVDSGSGKTSFEGDIEASDISSSGDISFDGELEKRDRFVNYEIDSSVDNNADNHYLLLPSTDDTRKRLSGTFYGARGTFGFDESVPSNHPAGTKMDVWFAMGSDSETSGSIMSYQGARGSSMPVRFVTVEYDGVERNAIEYDNPQAYSYWDEVHFIGYLGGISPTDLKMVPDTDSNFEGVSSDSISHPSEIHMDTGEVGMNSDLEVEGSAVADSWSESSDIRLKDNVSRINNSIEKLKQIEGIEYDGGIGVSAQELEEILPSLVEEDSQGYKTVDYSGLTPLLVEAVKEHDSRINRLENLILGYEEKD